MDLTKISAGRYELNKMPLDAGGINCGFQRRGKNFVGKAKAKETLNSMRMPARWG